MLIASHMDTVNWLLPIWSRIDAALFEPSPSDGGKGVRLSSKVVESLEKDPSTKLQQLVDTAFDEITIKNTKNLPGVYKMGCLSYVQGAGVVKLNEGFDSEDADLKDADFVLKDDGN